MEVLIFYTITCLDTNEIMFGIHRKPTYTDVVIPATFNHSMQHKLSAFNHMLDRNNNFPLSTEEK
jgi:hypothetical protein